MHPGLIGALARQKTQETLHRQEMHYKQLSQPTPSAVRGPGPLLRARWSVGSVLVVAGRRLMAARDARLN